MCIYVRQMPLCGHPPPNLLSYASCNAVLEQLMRIAEPEAWTPDALNTVPFDLPDDCDPRPENIWTLYEDDYCGWECRNNALFLRTSAIGGYSGGGIVGNSGFGFDGHTGLLPAYMPGDEEGHCVSLGGHRGQFGAGEGLCKEPLVLGMPDARYGPGSERLGIGWRDV